jgi:ribosomal protein L11 methyltransferase
MLEGLPPNDATQLLRFTSHEQQARAAADIVVDVFDPAETASAAFEDETSRLDPKPWIVEIYLGGGVDAARVRALLADIVGVDLAATIVTEDIARQDWVSRSLAGLAPVRAGRFLVYGAHDRADVQPNDVALEIEAALAFGTGHHGTTRGCLLALDSVLKRRRPRRVLDLGTGTGVLAMGAAKVLHRTITCSDLDGVAVAAARGNAVMNGVGPWVRPVRAAGMRHPVLRDNAPFDLVLANILAKPLRSLAPSVAAHAAPGADLILSGLLARDVPGVLSSYAAQGFALRSRGDLEGWATLGLRKRLRGKSV